MTKKIAPTKANTATKPVKAISEADALLLRLRRLLHVPRHGLPYLLLGMESPLRKTIPVAKVRALDKFKVIGKNVLVRTEVSQDLSKVKMTLDDTITLLKTQFGTHARVGELRSLVNTKASVTWTVYHPATPTELDEYKEARRALDISLLKAAEHLYEETRKLHLRHAANALARHKLASDNAEVCARKILLAGGLLKEYSDATY